MDQIPDRIKNLIHRPQERRSLELKGWLNPDDNKDIAKIVKGILALYNSNGGHLLIGFDDKTGKAIAACPYQNIQEVFHIDKIQRLVMLYSNQPIDIAVHYPEINDKAYPVIEVPSGVKTPAATKSILSVEINRNKKTIIKENAIYFRTLNSNNTISSSEARRQDWDDIMYMCFENREADIGRFFRRHLSSLNARDIQGIIKAISEGAPKSVSDEDKLKELVDAGDKRVHEVIKERNISIPDHGTFEVGVLVEGDIPDFYADRSFLFNIILNNSSYSGWPMWSAILDSQDEKEKPYIFKNAWESMVIVYGVWSDYFYEFWRIDPKGKLYLRRALGADTYEKKKKIIPLTMIDTSEPIIDVTEAIASSLGLVRNMGCATENTALSFTFRWTKLAGRRLGNYLGLGSPIMRIDKTHEDGMVINVRIKLDTPLSALSDTIPDSLRGFYAAFGGFVLDRSHAKQLVEGVLGK